MNWLISAILRLIWDVPRHLAMHGVKKLCGPKERPRGAAHHPDVPAGEFDAAWMRGKVDRLNAESARLEAQKRREAEINASAGKCWMCGAGIVTTADVELPIVCIECEDRADPDPPRR